MHMIVHGVGEREREREREREGGGGMMRICIEWGGRKTEGEDNLARVSKISKQEYIIGRSKNDIPISCCIALL